jgi:hypothetical protein
LRTAAALTALENDGGDAWGSVVEQYRRSSSVQHQSTIPLEVPMQANTEGSKPVVRRRSMARALVLLAAASSVLLLASCKTAEQNKGGPGLGSCRLPDGRILNGVTESTCTEQNGDWVADGQISALLPAGARLDSIPLLALQPIACGDTTQIDVELSWGAWIEWEIAWTAINGATARANWDSISYQLAVNDSVVALPDPLPWRTERFSLTCPDRTLTGVMMSQIVYLPPLIDPRTVTMTYIFNGDVFDGWSTYARGTTASYVVRLRPRS